MAGPRARRPQIEWLADLRQDARFALRSLRRTPGFAATAIVTMAVAIAANATIFSFVDSLLIAPLPYSRPHELVTIDANIVGSIGEVLALQQRSTGFSDVAMIRPRSITYGDDREAARLEGFSITPNLIPLLGVAPEIGRAFGAETSRPGAGGVILLSHALWVDRYGGDARVVGRYVLVDGVESLVTGVMPPSFAFPSTNARFWTPLTVDESSAGKMWAVGNSRWIARLSPGVTPERARATLATILPGFRRLNPLWDPGSDYGKTVFARPLQQSLVGSERPALLLLFACVGVVLLVACVNLANLMLARVTAREREFTVRSALGGGRGRLVRQLLTESVIVSLIGATLGFLLAIAGARWMVASLPPNMPRTADIRFGVGVFAFTAILAVATGIAFGLLPALRAAGNSGGRGTGAAQLTRSGVARNRLASGLVAGEVALAVLLTITAGLLTRSFQHLTDLSPGFRAERVMTARVSPPAASYADRARTSALFSTLTERLASTPGVTRVGLVDRLPIAEPIYGLGLRVQGQFEDATHELPTASHMQVVTPGYFSTLGIPIVGGRTFADADRDDAAPVAIVSRALARHFWPNDDAVGKRIGYPYDTRWITIVGVVPDIRLDSLRDTSAMAVYVPFAQRSRLAGSEMTRRRSRGERRGDWPPVARDRRDYRSHGPRERGARDGRCHRALGRQAAIHDGHRRRVRGRDAAARRGRHLRRDELRREPALARNGRAGRARRDVERHRAARAAPVGDGRRLGRAGRLCSGARRDARTSLPALRRVGHRPDHVRARDAVAHVRRAPREPRSGSPRDARRSGRGVARRVGSVSGSDCAGGSSGRGSFTTRNCDFAETSPDFAEHGQTAKGLLGTPSGCH